jgi:DNA-binding MarR family transcriptional regulator
LTNDSLETKGKMNEIKTTIVEQLQQLQMLMHRTSFHSFMRGGKVHSPHRGQGRVLAILMMKPEISQRELTYLLGMSKQSLTELLVKLEKSGYITREPSQEDKRVMTVRLTEAGMKAAEDIDDDRPETEKILDSLNDEELAAFSDYLGRIIKRYEQLFPDEDFDRRRKMMEEFVSRYGHGRGRGSGGFGGWHGRSPRISDDHGPGFFGGGFGKGRGHGEQ